MSDVLVSEQKASDDGLSYGQHDVALHGQARGDQEEALCQVSSPSEGPGSSSSRRRLLTLSVVLGPLLTLALFFSCMLACLLAVSRGKPFALAGSFAAAAGADDVSATNSSYRASVAAWPVDLTAHPPSSSLRGRLASSHW
jgi:hypothetical protein